MIIPLNKQNDERPLTVVRWEKKLLVALLEEEHHDKHCARGPPSVPLEDHSTYWLLESQ